MGNKVNPGVAVIIIVIAIILVMWQFFFKPKGPRVNIPGSSDTTVATPPPGAGQAPGGLTPGQPASLPLPRGKQK